MSVCGDHEIKVRLSSPKPAYMRVIERYIDHVHLCISRQHLKEALHFVTNSQDNHLRGLVLALITSQSFYTAGDHAHQMLQTCEQLAAGLGAPPSSKTTNSGQSQGQSQSQGQPEASTDAVWGNVSSQ